MCVWEGGGGWGSLCWTPQTLSQWSLENLSWVWQSGCENNSTSTFRFVFLFFPDPANFSLSDSWAALCTSLLDHFSNFSVMFSWPFKQLREQLCWWSYNEVKAEQSKESVPLVCSLSCLPSFPSGIAGLLNPMFATLQHCDFYSISHS